MHILDIILLLNFFSQIYTADPKHRETLYFQRISEDQAAESLIQIQPHQVLPLVLILEDTATEFQPPESFSRVFTNKRRIINRTQFTTKKSEKQFFFCPEENSDEKCLVRKDFQKLEPLQCANEAVPVIRVEEQLCGLNEIGTLYKLIYEICSSEEFDNIGKEIPIIEMCYDTNKNKTIYTNNHVGLNPKLLNSKVLIREHNLKYQMTTIDKFIPFNYEELKAAILKEEAETQSNIEDQQPQNKKQKIPNHAYKIQKLAPPEDVTFALWRKPFFQYFNVDWQHEKIIELWNEINKYIRAKAEELRSSGEFLTVARTGVFQLTSVPRNDGQLSNVWFKLIYVTTGGFNKKGIIIQGIIILVNNFINFSTNRDTSTSSSSEINSIKNYCEQNLCIKELKRKFRRVGSRVRCCMLTKKIREIIGDNYFAPNDHVLGISGINLPLE